MMDGDRAGSHQECKQAAHTLPRNFCRRASPPKLHPSHSRPFTQPAKPLCLTIFVYLMWHIFASCGTLLDIICMVCSSSIFAFCEVCAASLRLGRQMTTDVLRVPLRRLSDNIQVLCRYFAGNLYLGDSEDWWPGMYWLCKMFRDYFQPISSHSEAMVANFLFVANVVIADFLSKPSSWSSVGKLWEYLKISTCMLEDGLLDKFMSA